MKRVLLMLLASWSLSAFAATYGSLNYTVSNGKVTITDCNTSVTGVVEVPSLIEGCPVTSIGARAFEDCTGMTSIVLPSGVTSLGNYAFNRCTNLSRLSIPTSLTSLGYGVFDNCKNLYKDADGMCYEGEAKTLLIDYPYEYESASSTCVIPNSVRVINAHAFENANVRTVVVSSNLVFVGRMAFYNCQRLSSLKFMGKPPAVDNSGLSAFPSQCVGYYPSNYASEWRAVISSDKWKGISMQPHNDVQEDEESPFRYTSDGKGITITGLRDGSVTELIIPGEYNGLPVRAIGANAFKDCVGLTAITIPASVTTIGDGAFSGCSALRQVSLPVALFDKRAAMSVNNGNGWSLSDGVYRSKWIGNSSSTSLTLTIEGPCDFAFDWKVSSERNYDWLKWKMDGGNFTSICGERNWEQVTCEVPAGKHTITWVYSKDYSVSNGQDCGWVRFKTISASAKQMATLFPDAYTMITAVELVGEGASIQPRSFAGCAALKTLVIPEGVALIGEEAFKECRDLTSVTIPKSVITIGNNAFVGCVNLYKEADGAQYESEKRVVLVSVPSTFEGNFVIPEGVRFVHSAAFKGCSGLTSVTIPASVTSMGVAVFGSCQNLTKLFFNGSPVRDGGPFPVRAVGYYLPIFTRQWETVIVDGKWNGLRMERQGEDGKSVANVTFQQRYPWNGLVDITCTVQGSDPKAEMQLFVNAIDLEKQERLPVKSLWLAEDETRQAPLVVTPGTHHLVWDAGADLPNVVANRVKIEVAAFSGSHYLVVDLSGGPTATQYPISYLEEVPAEGWTDEYKSEKLVLRFIWAGSFVMGSPTTELGRGDNETQHQVTLTRPFYMGVFEVTQKQYDLIIGEQSAYYTGDLRPTEYISWDMIRGDSKTYDWPKVKTVDANSFMGKLSAKTGLAFDLPTEAQWEYVCRAGTDTALNSGKSLSAAGKCKHVEEVGRYLHNWEDGKATNQAHTNVGSYQPNAWGLYDMHGNVYEWCLDWFAQSLGTEAVINPEGAITGFYRVLRGGDWYRDAKDCRSAHRGQAASETMGFGFRVRCDVGL